MNRDIFLMPLGGGQRVGASCYYLRLGDNNILLDAGIGFEEGVVFEPDLYSLLTSPFIQSMNQINQIFISHAHGDHVGYLFRLMKSAERPSVYMSEVSYLLTEYQLYDKNFMLGGGRTEEERLGAKFILDKIVKVSYMRTMNFGGYKVTFLPAGHIPGAVMLLFEFGRRRILYTGDFSLEKTALTDGCLLPGEQVDTVILCGLHAKHPGYRKRSDSLYGVINNIFSMVDRGRSVMCQVAQLSKGIEFIKTLNQRNQGKVPVFIDDSILPLIEKMEQLSIPVLDENDHVSPGSWINSPHVYVTARNRCRGFGVYEEIKIDFSLHEDFSGMKSFIKKVNPKQAFLVHCSREYWEGDSTIEQAMMMDGECRTQFTFAEEKEIYKL